MTTTGEIVTKQDLEELDQKLTNQLTELNQKFTNQLDGIKVTLEAILARLEEVYPRHETPDLSH